MKYYREMKLLVAAGQRPSAWPACVVKRRRHRLDEGAVVVAAASSSSAAKASAVKMHELIMAKRLAIAAHHAEAYTRGKLNGIEMRVRRSQQPIARESRIIGNNACAHVAGRLRVAWPMREICKSNSKQIARHRARLSARAWRRRRARRIGSSKSSRAIIGAIAPRQCTISASAKWQYSSSCIIKIICFLRCCFIVQQRAGGHGGARISGTSYCAQCVIGRKLGHLCEKRRR